MSKQKEDQLAEMKKEKRWVCWKLETRKGQLTKPPYNPKTGKNAQANNPATWTDYQTAKAAADRGDYDGIGFVFTNGDYIGIDLDHVFDRRKVEILEPAEDLINMVDSYTEISPSGDGFHILIKGSLNRAKKDKRAYGFTVNGKKYKYEAYDGSDARYFTVTEKAFKNIPVNGDGGEERARAAYEKYIRKAPGVDQDQRGEAGDIKTALEITEEEGDFEISATLQKAFRSKNGDKIRRLYKEGDISDYNDDPSRADQALCDALVYWFNGDLELADRAFRCSALMRDKWDEVHYASGQTFGEHTLEKALELYRAQGAQETQRAQKTEKGRFIPSNVAEYLKSGIFETEIDYFRKYKDRKIGFAQLDGITLYPGLAFLGGVTSLGKTTFAVQLADHLADQGEHILYFAMEQQPIEIISKGLTRVLYEIDPGTPLTNAKIKDGATSAKLEEAKRIYADRSKNFTVVNCNFNTTVEQIREFITQYIETAGVSPVIFIDYLQLIAAPEDGIHRSDKERVDHVVASLKMLQQDYELLIVCMSNFNRMSYIDPVSESSFKESGMVEYCADYLWALQPAIMNDKRYLYKIGPKGGVQKTNDIEKMEMLKKERKRYPREIELVCMKNRNGAQYQTAFFWYYTRIDYFRENPDSQYNNDFVDDSVRKEAATREKIRIRESPSAYFDFPEYEVDDEDDTDDF